MALTNFERKTTAGSAPGNPQHWDIVEVDLDANYPTGGYDLSVGSDARALLDAQIGAGKTIQAVLPLNFPGTTKHYPEWDDDNDKLKMLIDATKVEAGPGDDLSSLVDLRLLILSI